MTYAIVFNHVRDKHCPATMPRHKSRIIAVHGSPAMTEKFCEYSDNGTLATARWAKYPAPNAFLCLLWREIVRECAVTGDDTWHWLSFAHHALHSTANGTIVLAAFFHEIGFVPGDLAATASRREAAMRNCLAGCIRPSVLSDAMTECRAFDAGTGTLAELHNREPVNLQSHIRERMENIYVFRNRLC
jgi:hypothetical protein